MKEDNRQYRKCKLKLKLEYWNNFLIDQSYAFDFVPHAFFLAKLAVYGEDGHLIQKFVFFKL